MSTHAEVIVLAFGQDEVMEPLTRIDEERSWTGRFAPIGGDQVGSYRHGWIAEFYRLRGRSGLLAHLESLAWDRPECVQVLIRNQDDDCFGLWMFHDGKLVEVPLPRTRRFYQPAPATNEFPPHPGLLRRTDLDDGLPEQTPLESRDPRPAW